MQKLGWLANEICVEQNRIELKNNEYKTWRIEILAQKYRMKIQQGVDEI